MAQGLRPCLHTRAATPRDWQVSGRDSRERRPGMGHPPARRRTLVVVARGAEPLRGDRAAPRMAAREALSLTCVTALGAPFFDCGRWVLDRRRSGNLQV